MAIAPIQVQRRLITVYEYEQMVRAGVFAEDDRLELIQGEILQMSPIGGLHIQIVNRLNRVLVRLLQDRAIVSIQNPVRLSNSEPQPDLAILRPEVDRRPAAVPGGEDVLLIIEVADTTAEYDRAVKVPLYASHGIREVWVIDVQRAIVETYRSPSEAGYGEKRTLAAGETLTVLALPGVTLGVDAILAGS